MAALLAGTFAGLLIGILLSRWRGVRLGISYGVLVASMTWAAAGIIAGNRAEEMAAIPYLVVGALVFWFIVVPASLSVIIQEWHRARGSADSDKQS